MEQNKREMIDIPSICKLHKAGAIAAPFAMDLILSAFFKEGTKSPEMMEALRVMLKESGMPQEVMDVHASLTEETNKRARLSEEIQEKWVSAEETKGSEEITVKSEEEVMILPANHALEPGMPEKPTTSHVYVKGPYTVTPEGCVEAGKGSKVFIYVPCSFEYSVGVHGKAHMVGVSARNLSLFAEEAHVASSTFNRLEVINRTGSVSIEKCGMESLSTKCKEFTLVNSTVGNADIRCKDTLTMTDNVFLDVYKVSMALECKYTLSNVKGAGIISQ